MVWISHIRSTVLSCGTCGFGAVGRVCHLLEIGEALFKVVHET